METYIRAGAYARKPRLPYTPGSDGAGVVAAVGSAVSTVRPGERVFLSGSITGTYAEVALCTPEQVHPLPEVASFAQGSALGVPYATAYRALFHRGEVRSGETVLVHGASGGGARLPWSSRAVCRFVSSAPGFSRGPSSCVELGADQVFNHNDSGYRQAILDATGGRGVDCILEMLANVNLGEDLRLLAPHGRVIVIGSRGRAKSTPVMP